MSISTFKTGLSRKLAFWTGERMGLERQIAKIAEEAATLEEKRQRVERLEVLISCSHELMVELDPQWTPDQVKPSVPKGQKLPYAPGLVTRWAMDLIRQAEGSFSSLELARKVVEMNNDDLDDYDLVNRVREAIDASLRGKVDKYVKIVSVRPTRWALIED